MTSALDIFKAAMSLMDELNDTGQANTADTAEYRHRTLPILNILRGELYPYSDTYIQTDKGKRPIVRKIENMDDEVPLDDYICQSVMPYGLAAHLLLDENPTAANFFLQKYSELTAALARGFPKQSEDIVDVYGGLYEYSEFGYW